MAQPISNLPIGSKIKFGRYQVETETPQEIIWKIADKNHNGYPIDSITLLTEKIIDLRGFDAKEPNNSNSDRQKYGNNRYKDSNIRQWLNKSGSNWFVKSHSADETPNDVGMSQPTGYDDKSGFLSCFTAEELNEILDTTLTVAKNTTTDGGGSETVTDKVFLLSTTETGLANENSIAEGSKLALFSDDASRIAYLTQQAFSNTLSVNRPSAIGNSWYYWLRTANSSSSYFARCVYSDGTLNVNLVYSGSYGVRPALNLKSDILVSDVPDPDGAYTIIWTTPLSTLPVGAIVKSVNTKYNNSVIRFIVGHQASGRTKLVAEKIITLKCFDAKEASNPDSNRQSSGNNRYSQSNIDKWLNSSAGAGAWYSAQHAYDAPPNNANVWSNYNEYDAQAGFLSFFEENFRNAILDTTIRIAKNTVTDGGGYEDITRKVYLLSETEVGLGNENGVAEGTLWDYFNSASRRQAYPTAEAVSASEYTNTSLSSSRYWYWWLRTPCVGLSNGAQLVYTNGDLGSDGAYDGNYGVRPALELASSILVSDVPDPDGAYTIIWTTPHVITLDKPITINAGEKLEKIKFNPKINGANMNLKYTDNEKLVYTAENLNTDTVNLEIEGKDGKIDNVAYVID